MPNDMRRNTESVTFRVDASLKTQLSQWADRDRKSLGELLRDIARERVQREQQRLFEAQARRQSLEAAAAARDPGTDEATVMRELEADLRDFNDEWK